MGLRSLIAALASTAALITLPVVAPPSAQAADANLSQGRTATSSSTENAATPAAAAVDGNTGTRWSSAATDDQWFQVDLGATASILRSAFQRLRSPFSVFGAQNSNENVVLPVASMSRTVRAWSVLVDAVPRAIPAG